MKDFGDDLQIFLDWIDKQIGLQLNGASTVTKSLVNSYRNGCRSAQTIHDMCCYVVVETFITIRESDTLYALNIKFHRRPSKEYLNQLLLEIPIKYVQLLLQNSNF
jgi:hypothetical protein